MCSTSTYQEDIPRAKDLGARGYLTKPPDFERLRSILEQATALRFPRWTAPIVSGAPSSEQLRPQSRKTRSTMTIYVQT
jgi:DNA-binding NarL/FixJ family response regulator